MDDIDQILSSKKKYENLEKNVKLIIKNLDQAIEKLEIPTNKIKSFYNIDFVSVDEGKLSLIRQNLINKRDYLKNYILEELEGNLKEIKTSIEGM